MAIYKNREVTFLAPVRASHQVESVTIVYKDGTHENVPLPQVKFTEDEKKYLLKNYPSKFDDVSTISDEDVKAVRLGVAPPSDPTYKEQAEAQVLAQKQQEENTKQIEAAKAQAAKNVDKRVSAPVSAQPLKVAPSQTTVKAI